MPELHVDAVIFDMDGTLIDTGDFYARHWRHWAAQHGLAYETVAAVHFGRPPAETIRHVAPELDAISEAARFNAHLTEGDAPGEVTALAGAADLLATLPRGRWTIATSATRPIAIHWLQNVGLPVPAELVSVEDVRQGKPNPDPYLLAAERLGSPPTRCLVIEDAPAGVSAAKAAGATVMALLTTHAADELAEADFHVAGLDRLDIATEGERLVVRWPDGSE